MKTALFTFALLGILQDVSLWAVTLVKDIRPGSEGSSPSALIDFNGTAFFTADDGTHGFALWRSDGTDAGTVMVKDIMPGDEFPQISSMTPVGDELYFAADDGVHGVELWKSDGTEAGTVMVADVFPGRCSSYPDDLIV